MARVAVSATGFGAERLRLAVGVRVQGSRLRSATRMHLNPKSYTLNPKPCAIRLHNSRPYSPPQVDRIWGIWGSSYSIPKAIFNLLKGDYMLKPLDPYYASRSLI